MGHYGAAVIANLGGTFVATWRNGLIKLYKAGVKDMLLTILDLVNCYIKEWFESDFGFP